MTTNFATLNNTVIANPVYNGTNLVGPGPTVRVWLYVKNGGCWVISDRIFLYKWSLILRYSGYVIFYIRSISVGTHCDEYWELQWIAKWFEQKLEEIFIYFAFFF